MPKVKKYQLEAWLNSTNKINDDDEIESILVKENHVEIKATTYANGVIPLQLELSVPLAEVKFGSVEVVEDNEFKTTIK